MEIKSKYILMPFYEYFLVLNASVMNIFLRE